jgi:hypothetical protein
MTATRILAGEATATGGGDYQLKGRRGRKSDPRGTSGTDVWLCSGGRVSHERWRWRRRGEVKVKCKNYPGGVMNKEKEKGKEGRKVRRG